MPFLRIILLCILAAVLFGVVHDQITARICVEYFTIGHPPIFDTENPTLLGLGWGVIATWWVGLLLGVPLALVARIGARPKKSAGDLVKPIAWLMVIVGACALISGLIGWFLANRGAVFLVGDMADRVPRARHVAFLAVLWTHLASYAAGFVGGIVLMIIVWRSRK